MKMNTDIWNGNVEVMIDCKDHFRVVRSARDAVECLMTSWPQEKGPAFKLARKQCLGAAEGGGSNVNARAAFVNAADEAGILKKN